MKFITNILSLLFTVIIAVGAITLIWGVLTLAAMHPLGMKLLQLLYMLPMITF